MFLSTVSVFLLHFYFRAAVIVCGPGDPEAALQEQTGRLHPQRLPLPPQAGRSANQADRRNAGENAGALGRINNW